MNLYRAIPTEEKTFDDMLYTNWYRFDEKFNILVSVTDIAKRAEISRRAARKRLEKFVKAGKLERVA